MNAFQFIRTKLPSFLIEDSIIRANLTIFNITPDSEFSEVIGGDNTTNLNGSSLSNPNYVSKELKKQIDLAYAECLKYILRLPASISQGGFSMSAVDKKLYLKELESIYTFYGTENEMLSLTEKPDITNAGEWR